MEKKLARIFFSPKTTQSLNMEQTKAVLRKYFLDKRRQLSAQERMRANDLLLIQFQQLELPEVQQVSIYMASEIHQEFDPMPLAQWLQFHYPDLRISVPVVSEEKGKMESYCINEETVFVPNKWGIWEPKLSFEEQQQFWVDPLEIDLVVVPLLAFDTFGNRVGYGKGYYDRYLKRCHPDVLAIGFSYFPPVYRVADAADFDVPLSVGITPEKIYDFK